VLEYCRLEDITIQVWSPFRLNEAGRIFIDDPNLPKLNATIDALSEKYDASKEAIATAWVLRHPANMQVIVSSMNPACIAGIAKAADVTLTRSEWYEIYLAAGNKLL